MGNKDHGKTEPTSTKPNHASGSGGSASTASTETKTGGRNEAPSVNMGNPKPIVVELPTGEAAEEKKKKRKERPTGLTYNTKNKKNTSKQSAAPSMETTLIMVTLVNGLFAIASTRLGDHWKLSDEETMNIATPATNILSRMVSSETMEKYSDGTALLLALSMAVIPRVAMSKAKPKKEGGEQIAGGNNKVREIPKRGPEPIRSDGAADSQISNKALFTGLSFAGY